MSTLKIKFKEDLLKCCIWNHYKYNISAQTLLELTWGWVDIFLMEKFEVYTIIPISRIFSMLKFR